MINHGKWNQTLGYVRRSGVHEQLEAQIRAGRGGRPRTLDVDVFLAAALLAFESGSTTFTQIHRVLTQELARSLQVQCRVRTSDYGTPLTVRQVRYLASAITNLFEYTPQRRPHLSEAERAQRRAGFEALLDQLVGEITRYLPHTGIQAVDATAVESAARGRRRRSHAAEDLALDLRDQSRDVDARWGYRTKTYDNKTSHVYGYQMIAFARAGQVGSDEPLILERIRVVPGNEGGISECFDVADSYIHAGYPVRELIVDRGFSYKNVDDWAAPLLERGIAQVIDMHPKDRGARPDTLNTGFLFIDGSVYCPQTPDHLRLIERPARFSVGTLPKNASADEVRRHNEDKAALERFNELIAEREQYRFVEHGKTSSGNLRLKCPARAGKIACDGCPLSLQFDDVPHVTAPRDGDRPDRANPTAPGGLRKACAQETITIAATNGLKLRQQHPWGSPEWQASYARRTRVEAGFGLLKTNSSGSIKRGWTRQVGLVKTTFMLAIAVTATNLRQLVLWAERTGNTDDPLTQIDTTDHGFAELDKHGHPIGNLPPPAAPTAA